MFFDYSTVEKDRVQLLVDALRSGEYGQCTSRLRGYDPETSEPNNDYCCLGVATDVYLKHAEIDEAVRAAEQSQLNAGALLSQRVSRWYGFPHTDEGWYTDSPLVTPDSTLASLNDSGSTFREISDIIEEVIVGGKFVKYAGDDDPWDVEVEVEAPF